MSKIPTSLPKQFRMVNAQVQRVAAEGEDASPAHYDLTFSSETEVERWYGIEVLSHDKGAMDLSRLRAGGAVLVDHSGDQVGVVRKASNDTSAKRGKASVQFSRSQRGQEIEQDVADEVRQNVSVGYFVNEMEKTGERNGVPVYTVTRWQPVEVSIVSVPADYSVGIGRSAAEDGEHPVTVRGVVAPPSNVEVRSMKRVRNEKGEVVTVADDDPREAVREASTDDLLKQDRERVDLIEALCERNGVPAEMRRQFIKDGLAVGESGLRVLEWKNGQGGGAAASNSLESMGLSRKDANRYSFARALLVAAGIEEGGVESEVDQVLRGIATSRDLSLAPKARVQSGGFFIPNRLSDAGDKFSLRALDSKTGGKGAEVVFESQGDLIELLRNRSICQRAGARVITGLTAPVAFPKQTGAMTATWVSENPASAVPASDAALALALLSPKTLQATTSYSRQFVVQASLDVESFLRNDLSAVHALAGDVAGIHGLSAAGEPTGVYKAVGVSSTAVGGAMTYAKVLDAESKVAGLNALAGTLAWIMNPTMAFNLKAVHKASNTYAPVWGEAVGDADGSVDGYEAYMTNQISKTMTGSDRTGGTEIGGVFGDWTQMIYGYFAGMEVIVDPYALKKYGMIELTTIQMLDILIRHGESFTKLTGATG